jgi:hypothetical protein
VSRHEVAYEGEDGHDHVLGDRDDVGASDFGNGDTAIGLVRGVEIDVVGADTSSDGELELLGLSKALCGQVAGVEAVGPALSAQLFLIYSHAHGNGCTKVGRRRCMGLRGC